MKCVQTGVGEVPVYGEFPSWVITIPQLTTVGLKIPPAGLNGSEASGRGATGLHMSKLSTTEAFDLGVVPTGPCLRTESQVLIREWSISRRLPLGIWLSGDWAHLVSHPAGQHEHLL